MQKKSPRSRRTPQETGSQVESHESMSYCAALYIGDLLLTSLHAHHLHYYTYFLVSVHVQLIHTDPLKQLRRLKPIVLLYPVGHV